MPRFYRLLLRAYPRSLRDQHGAEMAAAFDELWRRTRPTFRGRARLLVHLLTDFLTSLPREWRIGMHRREHQPPTGDRSPMPHLFTDIRTAARQLRRAPFFVMGATLTLGLGIGATTAIFSLADATLLRPIPIAEPERVYQSTFSWSLPDFRDLETTLDLTSEVAAWAGQDFGLDRNGTPLVVSGLGVSGRYFALAGVQPGRGRLLQGTDDHSGAPPVAVLGHRLWQETFGGNPDVIGQTIRLNQRPVTIVGITPAGFRGFSLRQHPDVYVSLSALSEIATGFVTNPEIQSSRDLVWLQVAGRLRDGVSPEAARSAMEVMYRRAHPPAAVSNRIPEPVELVPMTAVALGMGSSADLRRFLWVLMGATIVTLLLTCAAVAGLLIVRLQGRRREFAVRAALGGGRGRLVRLLLFESLALGLGGALVGLGAATVTLALLNTFQLPGNIAIGDLGVTLNGTLLAVAAGAGLLTSVVFGLAPMWQASKVPAAAALGEGGRSAARRPVRAALVGVQVAVCVVLLGGTLAFGRAIQQAVSVDLGFDTTQTSMVSVDASLVRRSEPEMMRMMQDTLEALQSRPEVKAAAWSKLRPYNGVIMFDVAVPGDEEPRSTDIGERVVEVNMVTGAYFDALGIPLRHGRALDARDDQGAQRVAIVSESMARKYWPGQSPLGRQVSTDLTLRNSDAMLTVVGVVADIQRGLSRSVAPTMYLPLAQQQDRMDFGGHYLFLRSDRQARGAALAAASAAIANADPNMPITRAEPLDAAFRDTLMSQRLGLTLFLLFATLAMILTGLGLYAIVAYAVTHRRREIGIRIALGASRIDVLSLITSQGLTPVLAGLAAGVGALWLARPAMDGFMVSGPAFEATPVAILALAIVALSTLAMLVPARRALRIAPTVALRED